ncbi:hypothetical protein N0V93_010150 [Gnomoniopsis smithogilvyi]|uniref:Uncharacterized protein n=1 Tax=Gnomoniopsis smithogilvyi TaxID=1191159 RepID=A0A9W9CSZ9_9PEZI|nr:hypothetical protein N0V93_010150 [Gnomoniopsis smithogilvyi]
MKSFVKVTAALLTSAVSSQQTYGSGSGSGSGSDSGSGSPEPVITSCPAQFSITSFSASCTPHGEGCSFSFDVATNASFDSPISCGASFDDVSIQLPLVPFTLCTDNHTIVWGWAPIGPPNGTATDYSLIIADSALNLAAAKIWDASDYPMVALGATESQIFNGSASFTM